MSTMQCYQVQSGPAISQRSLTRIYEVPWPKDAINASGSIRRDADSAERCAAMPNQLQCQITGIGIGLAVIEARHRPVRGTIVGSGRNDDHAPCLLAIREGAQLGHDQPLDLVLGLGELVHDPAVRRKLRFVAPITLVRVQEALVDWGLVAICGK